MAVWSVWRCRGSSPLTRGKHLPTHHLTYLARLIPAHAGKTPRTLSKALKPPAHPRSRGENTLDDLAVRGVRGSSPLTRGKLADTGDGKSCQRLIPAHAGKTVLTG